MSLTKAPSARSRLCVQLAMRFDQLRADRESGDFRSLLSEAISLDPIPDYIDWRQTTEWLTEPFPSSERAEYHAAMERLRENDPDLI